MTTDTRDPVTALAAALPDVMDQEATDAIYENLSWLDVGTEWYQSPREMAGQIIPALAEQGYVLVNAEGLAAVLAKDFGPSYFPGLYDVTIICKSPDEAAAAILAACLRAGEAEGKEQER